VNVTREISGVLTRVSVIGPMRSPELRLSSTPPLDPSDILSLIVFNTSANDLTVPQQQELAIRAGAIAAGFRRRRSSRPFSARWVWTSWRSIRPVSAGRGRVTIAEQLAPGLIARFSRQFGQEAIDEAAGNIRCRGCCESGDVFGCRNAQPAVAVPSRRARGDRFAGVFQLLGSCSLLRAQSW
jgi:hypothetical protein